MKFGLSKVRTSKKAGEQNSTIILAKTTVVLGEKPDQKRVAIESSITIDLATKRASKSDPVPGAEVGALRKLMELAVDECRKYEAEIAAK